MAPPAGPKKSRTPWFWIVEQGAAVWLSLVLLAFFVLFNPHANNAVEQTLWDNVSFTIIFVFYLGVTQMLPVIRAPLFESHFAPLKDIAVSIWPAAVILIAAILSSIRGVTLFGIDVDMTKIEMGIAYKVLVAFGLDILFGTIFTSMKNRLASEAGMGRMPG